MQRIKHSERISLQYIFVKKIRIQEYNSEHYRNRTRTNTTVNKVINVTDHSAEWIFQRMKKKCFRQSGMERKCSI